MILALYGEDLSAASLDHCYPEVKVLDSFRLGDWGGFQSGYARFGDEKKRLVLSVRARVCVCLCAHAHVYLVTQFCLE